VPPTRQTSPTSPPSSAQLAAELLAPADIGGPAWGATDPGSLALAATETEIEGCTSPLRAPDRVARASAGYLKSGGPEVIEVVEAFGRAPGSAFRTLSDAFGKCTTGGLKITPSSLGTSLGAGSAGFLVSRQTAAAAVFVVKGDQALLILDTQGRGASNLAAATRIAQSAAARLP
jgi:hypothetical protein